MNRSRRAFALAKKVIPGGVNSPVRAFQAVGGCPVFFSRGKGSRLFDLDGRAYIDFCMSWGALILGHAHPAVVRRVRHAVKTGTSFGAPTLIETELARLILSALPSMQQIRFVNSGTEAVMSAIRLARAFTHRPILVKFDGGYHGHADSLLVSAGSGLADGLRIASAGVPESFARNTISLPFNDEAALAKCFRKRGSEIAAVIVEPVPANMGVIPPGPGFLQCLRALTTEHDALLIFDEVITGFRLAWGGAQNLFEIRPDLTCLGKIIGHGFPAAAFGGPREIMSLLAPKGPVYQAGTLSGNPVAMAAGLAALTALKGRHAGLSQRAERFVEELRELAKGRAVQVQSMGPMFTLFFSRNQLVNYEQVRQCDHVLFARFYHALLAQGIYWSPSPWEANFLSTAHSGADLRKTLHAVNRALRAL